MYSSFLICFILVKLHNELIKELFVKKIFKYMKRLLFMYLEVGMLSSYKHHKILHYSKIIK